MVSGTSHDPRVRFEASPSDAVRENGEVHRVVQVGWHPGPELLPAPTRGRHRAHQLRVEPSIDSKAAAAGSAGRAPKGHSPRARSPTCARWRRRFLGVAACTTRPGEQRNEIGDWRTRFAVIALEA